MLPLTREFAARGWDVTVAGPEPFAAAVAQHGLDFSAVGTPWLEESAAATFPELEAMPLDEQGVWWVTDIFAGRPGQRTAQDLVELCARSTPDVIVRDYWDFGAWAAATALGIPCAVVGLAMHTTAEQWRDFIGDRLNAILETVGVPRDDELSSLYSGPYVDLLPPSYQVERHPTAVAMRSVERRATPRVLPWLETLPEPIVLVTLGTVFNDSPGVFESVISALADEMIGVVVTTGRNRDPASLGRLPANTRAVRYVDYGDLLPRCSAVLCHGGFGTVMAALAHDLPVITVPQSADQPVHAERCHALGAGLNLGRQPTTEAIPGAVAFALNDPAVRATAARLGAELRAMPPASVAADVIEHRVLQGPCE